MSTVKVNEVRHLSNSGTENIKLESNGTTNLQATSTLGLTVTGTLTVSGVSTFNGNMVVGNAITDTVDLQSKVTGFNNFSGFTGEIRMYAGNEAPSAPPTGWLYCNGDTISETSGDGGTHYNADGKLNDYQLLFNLLKANSNWGNSGSPAWGTDTVKLPDFRSRSPVGVHTGAATSITAGLTTRAISVTAGTETHVLLEAELATHTHVMTNPASSTGHAVSTVTATQPTHTHTLVHTHNLSSHIHTFTGTPMGTHFHGLSSDATLYGTYDGASANQSGTSGFTNRTTSADSAGTPAGTIGAPSNNTSGAASATTTSASGNDTITVSGGVLSGGSHTHVSSAANTGSNTPHTILSPIIAVNYIIKV